MAKGVKPAQEDVWAGSTECSICGVAYDVGCRSCRELGCKKYRPDPPVLAKASKEYKHPYQNAAYSRLNTIKLRALRRGFDCTLSEADVEILIDSPCVYCGSTERIEVDRKDSSKGYTPENTAPACRRCNTIKNNVVNYDEMMFIAQYLGWGWHGELVKG